MVPTQFKVWFRGYGRRSFKLTVFLEYENQHSFFTKNIVNFEVVLVRYVVKNEPLICEECLVDDQDVICHFNKFSKNNSSYNFTKFSKKKNNSYVAIFLVNWKNQMMVLPSWQNILVGECSENNTMLMTLLSRLWKESN